MRHLLDRRFLFFGGKGGVGKTTCAAAAALTASRTGRRVLLVSTDPAHSTSDVFEQPFASGERMVQPGLWGVEIDADTEVARYLQEVRRQIERMFSAAVVKEAARQIETAASMPGVADVALFDRMASFLLDGHKYDLVVFDTAPTGHTLRLLRMPELMGTWIEALARRRRVVVEDARAAAAEPGDGAAAAPDPILETLERRGRMLADVRAVLARPESSAFVFVLLAERLPIEETARALDVLRQAGLPVGGLIVNRVLPDDLEGGFYQARRAQEAVYRREIARRFSGVQRAVIPQFASDVHGLEDLARVAAALFGP